LGEPSHQGYIAERKVSSMRRIKYPIQTYCWCLLEKHLSSAKFERLRPQIESLRVRFLGIVVAVGSFEIRQRANAMDERLRAIQTGFHVYLEEGGKDFGAVRQVAPGGRDEIIVYIQNEGNFIVPARAVRTAQDSKVMLDRSALDGRVLGAISRAQESVKASVERA
jgi:hypothetical protein